MVQDLVRDLRFAFRGMRRRPGSAILAVFILAIGIGVNTAGFNVLDAIVVRTLDYPNFDRIVLLFERHAKSRAGRDTAPAAFLDWKQQSRAFDRLAAFRPAEVNVGISAEESEGARAYYVSPGFFDTIGVRPLLGRLFLPQEEAEGAGQAVLLSYGFWKRAFGGDPNLAGRSVKVDGRTCTVAGVMPSSLRYPWRGEIWLPMALTTVQAHERKAGNLTVLGLLKPNVSLPQARGELDTIGRYLAGRYPETNRDWTIDAMLLRHDLDHGNFARRYSLLLLGATGFVLLIVCVNVANLQLARAIGRSKEIAVRKALGASRGRLIRQMLAESLVMCAAGGAVGLLVAQWALDLFISVSPPEHALTVIGFDKIGLDVRAMLYTLAITLSSAVLAGMVPALRGSRADVTEGLKESSRGQSGGRSQRRLRGALVVVEVALALILVLGAGVFAKAFRGWSQALDRLAPKSLVTMQIGLKNLKPQEAAARYRRLIDRVQAVPGVGAVAAADSIPHGLNWSHVEFAIEGRSVPLGGEPASADGNRVTPDYFDVLKLPVRSGRGLARAVNPSVPEAVVSESLARRYFRGEDPIGKRIRVAGEPRWLTIVGVGGDIWHGDNGQPPRPMIYASMELWPADRAYLVARISGDETKAAHAIKAAIALADPEAPVFAVRTMEQLATENNLGIFYIVGEMAILAAVALVLAVSGVYGVMAYSVGERRYEIGIRMAVGADRSQVLRMIVASGLRLAGTGILIGLAVGSVLTRVLASLTFGVPADDPVVFTTGPAAVALAALAACYLPAHQAASAEPARSLSAE